MTDRQRAFLVAYLAGGWGWRRNATNAAASAGYAWPAKQGPRLTTFPEIAAEIRATDERLAAEWKAERKAARKVERKAEAERLAAVAAETAKMPRGPYKRRRRRGWWCM